MIFLSPAIRPRAGIAILTKMSWFFLILDHNTKGKTHTMHGILMAAGRDLFGMTMNDTGDDDPSSSSVMSSSTTDHRKSLTTVRISCMELYNEELRDLLVCGGGTAAMSTSLPIQEDRRGNVQISGLTERTVHDIDGLMDAVRIAEGNRTTGSTAMNERSSRSHTIFGITYERREAMTAGVLHPIDGSERGISSDDDVDDEDKENDDGTLLLKSGKPSSQKVITTVGNLYLVDLAGSESVRVTGATGQRQKEGGKINQR